MAEVSRRDFFKTAAAAGATAAAASVVAPAAAVADEAAAAPAEAGKYANADVYEADVLVIGGGISGCVAARRALAKGSSVIVVDKGPWGHSGTSGINWGHDSETNEWSDDDGSGTLVFWLMCHNGIIDQTFALALCQAVHEARPDATAEQLGCILQRTSGDNEVFNKNAVSAFGGNHGTAVRYFALDLKRSGARIFDRTDVLDILTDANGNAAGAVAIDLVTGAPRVFRAKTVVAAMGSFCWISGWNGMGAYTIGSPDNTGDGHAILLRKGIAMRDMEQEPFDNVQWTPMSCRQGMGCVGGAITNHWMLHNKNHERITTIIDQTPAGKYYGNLELMRMCVRTILDGDATENGGFLIPREGYDDESNNRYYRRCRENILAGLGYELPEWIEVVPEQWETAGRPYNYSTTAETDVPGLFYAASGQGAWFGMAFFGAYGSGFMAGDGAAVKAAQMNAAPAINWADVDAALDAAYAKLDSEPADPIRSTEVFRHVQEAYWSGMGPIRNAEGINAAVAELDRIEAEELPRMYVPSKTRRMNSDWQRAIEVPNLITCARAVAAAALAREETRGAHCRTDFPQMDNENWLVATKTQLKDGQMTCEITDLDTSIIDKATLATLLPDWGIDIEVVH